MKAEKFLNSNLSKQSAKFFVDVIKAYGTHFSITHLEIGNKLGMTYENVRLNFKSLEKIGCVTINKEKRNDRTYTMNVERFNQLFE